MAITTPLSYWKLDESSGNAIDSIGSLSAVNTSVTYSAGKINNGAIYNGSAFHAVADNAAVKPSSDISFGGWVNITSTASYQMMIAKGENTGDTRSYELRCDASTTKMQVQLRVGGGSFCACTSTTAIGTGTWTHVIYTRTGTTQKIYINGVSDTLTGVTNNSGTIDYSTDDLWFGQRNGGLRFNGKLDEIGIWNVALTSTEVTSLYNGGTGLQYPFTGILIDSTGSASPASASSSTRTVSFTNTAGTFMVVGITRFRSVTTNSVTYNGVAMTKAVESIDGGANRAEIWYLASPATGANNLVITFSSATDDGVVIGFQTMTGVNNASPIGTTANQTVLTNSTAPSIAITTANNNSYIFDCLYRNETTETATSPQTEVWGRTDSYTTEGGAGSYKAFATAGATTMAWTLGASKFWIMCAVEIKESTGAAATNSAFFMFM